MRPRFKPNITPRGTRRNSTSNSNTSTSKKPNISKETSGNDTSEQTKIEPFIPPNSSKGVEHSICEEAEITEDTSEIVVVKTAAENDPQKQGELKSSTISKDKKPSTTRRSRIKPSVTPVSRRRNNARTKETDDNGQNTLQDEFSVETSVENDEAGLKKHQNDYVNIKTTASTTTEIPSSNTTTTTTTTLEPQTVAATSTDDGKTPISTSSLSRRRRTTPKICIPPRKRRITSLSNESVDKMDGPLETPQNEVNDEELDKEVPEASVLGKTSKRQKLPEEVVEEDIGVIEVTVQTGQQKDIAVADEEQDDTEKTQSLPSKKIQLQGKKKRVPIRKPKEMLDPSKMTLQDLIYFNPKENFMKSSTDAKNKRIEKQKGKNINSTANTLEIDEANTENQSNNQQTTDRTDRGEDSTVCAPQVKIAADGSIIVDEESLLIRSPTHSTLEDTEIVYEDANNLNYDFYGKGVKRTRWSMPETLKFYKALSQVGTDFQLMVPLFPMRSRKELKAKFKKEEKVNYELIDKVLVHHSPISLEMFLQAEKDDTSKNSKKKAKKHTDGKEKETEQEDLSNSKRKRRRQTNVEEKETEQETEQEDSSSSKKTSRRQTNSKEKETEQETEQQKTYSKDKDGDRETGSTVDNES